MGWFQELLDRIVNRQAEQLARAEQELAEERALRAALQAELAAYRREHTAAEEAPERIAMLLSRPPISVEHFRWQILLAYGWTPSVMAFLEEVPIEIKNLHSALVGGGETRYLDHISLNGISHEAALHELCHWVAFGWLSSTYLATYVKELAAAEAEAQGDVKEFIHIQLYGHKPGDRDPVSGGVFGHAWPGALDGLDPRDITPDDFEGARPQYGPERSFRHIWVSFCSYTMGQYRTGPRALPQRLWRFFGQTFTGTVTVKPYYEGGPR